MGTPENKIQSGYYIPALKSSSWLLSIGVLEVRVCIFSTRGKQTSFAVWSFESCLYVTIADSNFESSPVQERIVAVHRLFCFAVPEGKKIIFADKLRDTLIREVYMVFCVSWC